MRSAVGDLAPDRVDDVVRVAHGDRPDVDHPVRQHDGLHQRMAVRLHESRHDAAVAYVDVLRPGADPALDIRPVTDGDDAAIGHRERLGGGSCVVDGENGSRKRPGQRRALGHPRSPEKSLKKFRGPCRFGGLPFDVVCEGTNGRAPSPTRRRQNNVALHADHAVHPRGRGGHGGARTSTSTRSSLRWAATTRSSSRPV